MAPTNRARNARAIEADFDRALATLVETATRSIRVQRASVWFVEDGDSAWRQHDVYDAANDKHASGITMRADDYPELAAALASAEVVAIADARTDSKTAAMLDAYLAPFGIGAVLDAPIHADGRMVGALILEHVGGPREFTADERTEATALANLLAIAWTSREQVARGVDARNALSLLQAAFEATGAAILAVDRNGAVSAHNQRFVDLFQVPAELMGPAGDNGPRIVHMSTQVKEAQWLRDYAAEIAENPDKEFSGIVEFHDGRWIEGFSQPQRLDGEVIGRVWSFRDVTEHRRLQEQLRELSIRDPLTQLFNRRCAEERLDLECQRAQRSGHPLSVALLDVDHFKAINDLHGHHVGDEVLCALADDLRRRLRATDVICRWGGEEFLILLGDTEGDHAIEVIDELRRRVSRERRDLPEFTFSAGVAQYDGKSSWNALVKRADARMYEAKQTGRNRVA